MASNALATDLYAKLASSTENLVFSPASISVALAMTYAGSRGATAAELQTSLHFDLVPEGQRDATYQGLLAGLEKHRPGVELVVANRLFCEKSAAFERPFLDRVARVFRAPLGKVDFKNEPDRSTDEINRWVSQRTRAKIQNVIPKGTLTSDARLVITNAVYFKGRWAEEFKRSDTSDAPFHTADGRTVTVGMMHQTKSFGAGYSAADHLKVVELPYRGGDLSMVVLLPDAVDGIGDLERKVRWDRIDGWIGALHRQEVVLALPRFRVAPNNPIDLTERLKALGIRLLFDPDRADLTGIAKPEPPGKPLFVTKVFHQGFIDVAEQGTEAAAATAVLVALSGGPPPTRFVFVADHPFIYLIRDTRTGLILFMGKVVDPTR